MTDKSENKKIYDKLYEQMKTTDNMLEKYVLEDILDNDTITYMNEVITHGCKSGVVRDLIYDYEIYQFYSKYKYEINEIIEDYHNIFAQFANESANIDELIKKSSWFAYERIVYNILKNDYIFSYHLKDGL